MHGILTLDPYTFVDLRCFLGDGEKPEGLESVSKIKKKHYIAKKKFLIVWTVFISAHY